MIKMLALSVRAHPTNSHMPMRWRAQTRLRILDCCFIMQIKKLPLVFVMVDHFTVLTVFLGIFFGAAIILAVVVFAAKSHGEKSKREHELAMERINLEKERARKEIIMIPCRYCGGLLPQASTFCPNCGARRTA